MPTILVMSLICTDSGNQTSASLVYDQASVTWREGEGQSGMASGGTQHRPLVLRRLHGHNRHLGRRHHNHLLSLLGRVCSLRPAGGLADQAIIWTIPLRGVSRDDLAYVAMSPKISWDASIPLNFVEQIPPYCNPPSLLPLPLSFHSSFLFPFPQIAMSSQLIAVLSSLPSPLRG